MKDLKWRNVHPTAHIGSLVRLGHNVTVGALASIDGEEAFVDLGDNVVIGPGARIGQVGFGYAYDEEAGWMQKPHKHGVLIEDNVHIGANTCIDRGSWRATRIKPGVRIDNLVHIAHNVIVGARCAIVAQAEISGSVVLADRVYVGPCASIRERLVVGEGAIVGMGAVVVENVAPHMIVAGVPARVFGPVTEWPPPPPR